MQVVGRTKIDKTFFVFLNKKDAAFEKNAASFIVAIQLWISWHPGA